MKLAHPKAQAQKALNQNFVVRPPDETYKKAEFASQEAPLAAVDERVDEISEEIAEEVAAAKEEVREEN